MLHHGWVCWFGLHRKHDKKKSYVPPWTVSWFCVFTLDSETVHFDFSYSWNRICNLPNMFPSWFGLTRRLIIAISPFRRVTSPPVSVVGRPEERRGSFIPTHHPSLITQTASAKRRHRQVHTCFRIEAAFASWERSCTRVRSGQSWVEQARQGRR